MKRTSNVAYYESLSTPTHRWYGRGADATYSRANAAHSQHLERQVFARWKAACLRCPRACEGRNSIDAHLGPQCEKRRLTAVDHFGQERNQSRLVARWTLSCLLVKSRRQPSDLSGARRWRRGGKAN